MRPLSLFGRPANYKRDVYHRYNTSLIFVSKTVCKRNSTSIWRHYYTQRIEEGALAQTESKDSAPRAINLPGYLLLRTRTITRTTTTANPPTSIRISGESGKPKNPGTGGAKEYNITSPSTLRNL